MDRLLVIGVIVVLLAIGFIRVVARIRETKRKKEFAEEFVTRLIQYVMSEGSDHESYVWLTHRSAKMQSQSGIFGIARSYRPPFEGYVIPNYQIIVNALPELRRSLEDSILSSQARQYSTMIQECLIRYIGVLDDQLERSGQDRMNPLIWLREGVQLVMVIPVFILNWVGLVTTATVARISDSTLLKMFSGLIALIGLLSAIVSAVIGWEDFVAIVRQVLNLS